MGIKACQKAVLFSYLDLLIPIRGIEETEECRSASTREEASAQLSHFTQPGKGDCQWWRYDDYRPHVRCYPVGPMQVSIEKPNWLQRIGIRISDLWNRVF